MRRFHITGSPVPRPAVDRVLFCDGGVDESHRDGVDVELSHWVPNRTPPAFKADTSTEICLRFVTEGPGVADSDLVVNNHVDVDGVLSVFVLLFDKLAAAHRSTLVQAAEMGDFGGWGEPPAQLLHQSLALLIQGLRESTAAPQEAYARCFDRVHAVLAGETPDGCTPGLEALARSVNLIDQGVVTRTVAGPRLVHYAVPRSLAERDLPAALHVPGFGLPLSARTALLSHARARLDREHVHLVSVETASGWYYDLLYPGYTWADTVSLWRPPGVRSSGNSNLHYLDHPPLDAAATALSHQESKPGQWVVTRELSPFATIAGRNFPVVLSLVSDRKPAPSALPPKAVLELLQPAFGDA